MSDLHIVEDTSPQLGGDLDLNGHAIAGATATEIGYLSGVTSAIQTQLDATEKAANKNQPNGYPGLDANGNLVDPSFLATARRPKSVRSCSWQARWPIARIRARCASATDRRPAASASA